MKNAQRQTMKMQQKLSPQQLMLMRLVQLPVTSLEQLLKEEVEKNPLLEPGSEGGPELEQLPDRDADADPAPDDSDDYDYRLRQEADPNAPLRSPAYAAYESFSESLLRQVALKNLTDRQRLVAEELLGSIDDAGYLSRSVELVANDLAFTQGVEVSPREVEEVLAVVQECDPPGIAARSLQECLALQLRRAETKDQPTADALRIVEDCFDPYVKHNYGRIGELLQMDEERLSAADRRILQLDPKPGAGESESAHAHYIVPDFIVTRHDNELLLTLNNGRLPRLRLSTYYQDMLRQYAEQTRLAPADREALDFLRDKSDSATLLIDTLRQRHATMLRVMQAVLRRQRRFFFSGNPAHLAPLLQKDIASQTGLDISTVSRVVNSKYVQTDFGTLLLKECFVQSLTTDGGEEVATEAVRQALAQAVDQEDKQSPLTDTQLARRLNELGFPVARRTVAKYREMLGIPVGRLRRKVSLLLLLLSLALPLSAQQPQKESYFDSIINARIRAGRIQGSAPQKEGAPDDKRPPRRAIEEHAPEPAPTAIDTALANGDDLIDVMYDASLPPPSALWYGRRFSGDRVRMNCFSMDSLPDEISFALLKGAEKFCFPVKNVKTSPYGWRWNRPHRGVDIRLSAGDPVRAAFNGVVRIARPMGAYGNLVVLRHYNGLETVYGHLSKINVKPMQVVRAGQTIGLGGSTGRSTGPHLHFEVRFQYEAFDPEWILDFSNYSLRTRRLYLDKTYFGIRRPRAGVSDEYRADRSIVPEEPPRPAAKPLSGPIYATMRQGEKAHDFAQRQHLTMEELRKLNPSVKKFKGGARLRIQ